jgi:transposase
MVTPSAPGRTTANLSDLEVAYILGMSDAGASNTAISAQMSRPRSTVANAIEKYDIKTFTGVAPLPGNPKKLTEHQKRTLKRVMCKNRRKTLEDITNILPQKSSIRTLQRQLSTLGIKKHIAIKKPFLNDEHKCQRLAFCEEHKDWTVDDWRRVIFSDECKVEIGKQARAAWVYRTEDERYHDDCLVPALKGSRASIMVWGCFSANKLGPLLTFSKKGASTLLTISPPSRTASSPSLNVSMASSNPQMALSQWLRWGNTSSNKTMRLFTPQHKPIVSSIPTASSS